MWRCRLFLHTGRRDVEGPAIQSSEHRAASTRWISRSRRAGLHGAAEEDEDADDRQVGFHRRRQRRRGHAGQPRVLGLHGRIDGARPLRIVDDFRGELGQRTMWQTRQIEGGGRADRSAPVDDLGPSAVMITLPG